MKVELEFYEFLKRKPELDKPIIFIYGNGDWGGSKSIQSALCINRIEWLKYWAYEPDISEMGD